MTPDLVQVNLDDRWRDFISAKVSNGSFRSVDELMTAALCLLENQEHQDEQLAALLEESERAGGFETWDYQQFLRR